MYQFDCKLRNEFGIMIRYLFTGNIKSFYFLTFKVILNYRYSSTRVICVEIIFTVLRLILYFLKKGDADCISQNKARVRLVKLFSL